MRDGESVRMADGIVDRARWNEIIAEKKWSKFALNTYSDGMNTENGLVSHPIISSFLNEKIHQSH